jgi:O-antigen ligase
MPVNKSTVQKIFLTPSAFTAVCLGTLIGVALFVSSRHFVNHEVSPKWFGTIAGVSVVVIAFVFAVRKVYVPSTSLFLLITASCLTVLFRDWSDSGFNVYLLTQTVFIILLFMVMQQATTILSAGYLYGLLSLFAAVLAVQGLLQYAGVFHGSGGGGGFKITGSFDNPAGYASALVCVYPYLLRFIRHTRRRVRHIATVLSAVAVAAAALSESRAATVACIAVTVCYLFSRYSGLRIGKPVKIITVCAALAGMTGLYALKKDSADGRLLIWQSTLNMIKDKPFAGHGYGAFNAKYMLYQGAYFDARPAGRNSALADNVLHPFNEYLLTLSEHGVAGLGVLVLLGLLIVRRYFRNPDSDKFIALLSLLSLAVFSCFSYPLEYPFSWIIVFLNMAVICPATKMFSVTKSAYFAKTTVCTLAAGLLFAVVLLTGAEMKWNTIARQSLSGKTLRVLPEYEKLYSCLHRNGLFLYNHAAELHEVKEYGKSLSVFDLCVKYYNDMDVQMLLADNYKKLGLYAEAERHLKLAASMCPNRFMPLYQLTLLYMETNRNNEALILAQHIVDKEVKIPSSTVNAIKNKMRQLLKN